MEIGFQRGVSRALKVIESTTRRIEGAGGKMYSFCAMYSLRMSFWIVPEMCFQFVPLFSAATRYMAQIIAAGELMVIEVETRFHVGERGDGDAALAYFAFGERMVGIIAHKRRQVEGDGKAGLALFQKIMEALVGVLRAAKARKLPHRPELAPVHRTVNPASVRVGAGIAKVALVTEIPEVLAGVKGLN